MVASRVPRSLPVWGRLGRACNDVACADEMRAGGVGRRRRSSTFGGLKLKDSALQQQPTSFEKRKGNLRTNVSKFDLQQASSVLRSRAYGKLRYAQLLT